MLSPAQLLKGDTRIKSGYDEKRVIMGRGVGPQFQESYDSAYGIVHGIDRTGMLDTFAGDSTQGTDAS